MLDSACNIFVFYKLAWNNEIMHTDNNKTLLQ